MYKLLILLILWASWRLMTLGWRYRHTGGCAISIPEPVVISHVERLPLRRDPLVTHRTLFPRMGNCEEKGAAHIFGMCLL